MGRRRIDWIQFVLLLLAILVGLLRTESRISRIEQHLEDQDKDNAALRQRLEQMDMRLGR